MGGPCGQCVTVVSAVVSAVTGRMVLSCIRKQSEQAMRKEPISSTPPWPQLGSDCGLYQAHREVDQDTRDEYFANY